MILRWLFPSFIIFLLLNNAFAQPIKVFGTITNTNLEPLPYASIEVKEEQLGKIADAKGNYEFTLKEGKYDLIVSLVGYKTQVITVVLDKITLPVPLTFKTATFWLPICSTVT